VVTPTIDFEHGRAVGDEGLAVGITLIGIGKLKPAHGKFEAASVGYEDIDDAQACN
jgi:hypothetical protein